MRSGAHATRRPRRAADAPWITTQLRPASRPIGAATVHIVVVDAHCAMSGEAGPSSSYQDDDQWEQLPASALNDEDAGWERCRRRKPPRKAAAPAADARRRRLGVRPVDVGAAEAPVAVAQAAGGQGRRRRCPARRPTTRRTARRAAARRKARKRKGRTRAPSSRRRVRLLQNFRRDGHMTVETLGQAVADAMGGASWNKKWKPLVGSLKEFAGSSRSPSRTSTASAALPRGRPRARARAEEARQSGGERRQDGGRRRRRGGRGEEGSCFIGTRSGWRAAPRCSPRACAAARARSTCPSSTARPCLNGTAAGVGGGECVATGRTAELARRCARRWAPAARGRDDAAPVSVPDIVGASWELLTPLAEALAAAAADGHASRRSRRCCAPSRASRSSPPGCSCAQISPPITPAAGSPLTRAPTSAVAARGARRGGPPLHRTRARRAVGRQRARRRGRRARAARSRVSIALWVFVLG